MKTQKYIAFIVVGVTSFLLGASITHFGRFLLHERSPDSRYMNPTMHNTHHQHDGKMKNGNATTTVMGDMTMNDMVSMLQGKTGRDLEREFLVGMIPHHQGAVDMARVILADTTTRPEIRAFAESIIKAQEAEIAQMNKWLSSQN
jgi:uncharacterized protein (DUF305 family)